MCETAGLLKAVCSRHFEQYGSYDGSQKVSTKGVSGPRFGGDASFTDRRRSSRFRALLRLTFSAFLFRSNALQAELFSRISLEPTVFTCPEREFSQRLVTTERERFFSISVFIFVSVPLRLRTSRVRFFVLLPPVLRLFPVSLLPPTLELRIHGIRVLLSRLFLLRLSTGISLRMVIALRSLL